MADLVVIADQLLAPVPGGTGRYAREILRALAHTAPEGWTVRSVVCRTPNTAAAEVDGVDGPHVLPVPRRALVTAWMAGLPYWPGGNAVHATTPFAPPSKRGSLTVTVHDAVPWTHPETLTKWGAAWHRTMIKRAMRTADAVIVPTEAVAAELAAHVAPRTASLQVIGHGVTKTEPVDVGHLDLPKTYVLAVGTLEPRKGVDVLIEAMGQWHRSNAQAPALVLAGQPGWGAVDPAALAASKGLPQEAVKVLGRLPDGELAAVVQRAAVLAAPSRAEGFGLPVLEAMAAGIPVAVPAGDPDALAGALQDVVHNRTRAAQMSERGRRRAREFDWHTAATAIWKLHAP